MAALAGMLAKSMAKGMAKSAAYQIKSEARDLAQDLKNEAKVAATNYLDAKKNRIYQTASNAFYTKTGSGGRNYRPTPAYRNVVGTNKVKPLY